jgi:hypothetical protein
MTRRPCGRNVQLKHATRRGASQHLEEARADGIENESVEQIAFADKLLLNKARLLFAPRLAPASCLRPPRP